ncbi:MAG TPA: UbiA family prenyltransferase [Candidatus Paceibacterota bacterium]|nr:UbiA family prenyltransferase [Candidatus Paceibacterota bacterium]
MITLEAIGHFSRRALARLETMPLSAAGWFTAFGALVVLRNFLEGISQRQLNVLDADNLPFLAHASAFYLVMFGAMILGLAVFTGERFERVSRFVLVLSGVIVLAPLFDLFATGGTGATMAYRTFGGPPSFAAFSDLALWSPFGLLFWPGTASATDLQMNFGIRLEIMLIFLALIWYVYLKTGSPIRFLTFIFFLYVGLYAVSALPLFLSSSAAPSGRFLLLGHPAAWLPSFDGANTVLFAVYVALALVIALVLAWSGARRFVRVAVKNIRSERLLVNLALFGGGVALGLGRSPALGAPRFFDWLVIGLGLALVVFRWVWAVSRNDLADEVSDKLNAPGRPLPSGVLSRPEMATLSRAVGLAALVISSALGTRAFFLTVLWGCVAYLYSEAPFRLKRYPIISNLLLGGAHLLTVLTGFVLVGELYLADFPAKFAVLFLVGAAFGAEFINIKDAEGDKKTGVLTIPNIFPGLLGRRLVGFMGAFVFFAVPLAYPAAASLLVPLAFFASIFYYCAAARTPYKEAYVFLTYAGYVAAFVALIISGYLVL